MRSQLTMVLCLLLCLSFLAPAFAQPEDSIRVMTFNIRYNNPDDGVNAWPNRKDRVAEMIGARYEAGLAGLQEVKKDQLDDLIERLPEYDCTGVGRDDGKTGGEYTPIFYRKDRFQYLGGNTFWLSETPDVIASKSWDTSLTRIATWARFKDRKTGKIFYMFNTHFDHRGQQARKESAKLIWKKITEIAGSTPVVLTGDFNCRESSQPYAVLTGKLPIGNGTFSGLTDARYVSNTPHEGPTSTFTNWKEHGPPETKIDFIFIGNQIRVWTHKILPDKFGEYYPSDHLPVLADVSLP